MPVQVLLRNSPLRFTATTTMMMTMMLLTMLVDVEVDAIKCYSCSGKTDDGSCGTPFRGGDLPTCEGSACVVARSIVESKQASCVSWTSSANTVYDGCFPNPSSSTLAACQLACFIDANCVGGIDWAPDKTGSDRCCLAGPSATKNRYATIGVTHYNIVRSLACQAPCRPGPLFLAVGNTAYSDASSSSSTTVGDCQQECVADANCRGIDWSQQQSVGRSQCRLVGESARKSGPSPGTTHYTVYRNFACKAGAYEIFSRTCSATFGRDVGTCRPTATPGGISCACATRFCNGGKRNELMTVEYQRARESHGIVDRPEEIVVGDDRGGNDGGGQAGEIIKPTEKTYLFYQLFSGSKRSNGDRLSVGVLTVCVVLALFVSTASL